MNWLLVCVAASALGIEVGWQPLDQGGHEYTIQIEPQLLDRLRQGDGDIVSEVPPHLDVRRYRITTGTGKLARVDGAPTPAKPPAGAPAEPTPAGPTLAQPTPARENPAQPTPAEPTPAPALPANPFAKDHEAAEHHEEPPAEPQPAGPVMAKRAEHDAQPPRGAPGALPEADEPAKPIEAAAFSSPTPDESSAKHAEKAGTAHHSASDKPAEAPRPWFAFLTAAVLLCCSLGANFYLGWIAWEARARYRDAVSKFRAAPAG